MNSRFYKIRLETNSILVLFDSFFYVFLLVFPVFLILRNLSMGDHIL